MLPAKDQLTICFAHAAYQMQTCFAARDTGISSFELRERTELDQRIGEADVLVVSGMWHNGLIPAAGRLRFIQSISSGTDQYDKAALAERGIRLASAQGVNARAVAEHAVALMLALARRLPEARDNQMQRVWRGMIGDLTQREDELGGKTLLVIGLGRIGSRLAQLAKAFDMRVIGFRRDPSAGAGAADAVHTLADLPRFLPQADFVALTCALTDETRGRDRCVGTGGDAALRVPGELRARRLRGRAGTARRAAIRADCRRGAGRDRPGTAGGRLAIVGHAERADHAAHRRGDP